jgi:hypothetical protein
MKPPKRGRPSTDECEARSELVYQLLCVRGLRKSAVKRIFATIFGRIHHVNFEKYATRARTRLLMELREDKEIHRGGAYAFYRSILSDVSADARTRLNAERAIDKLLGLCIPRDKSPDALLEALGDGARK